MPSKEQQKEPEPGDDFRWCGKEPEEWQAKIEEMVVTARRVALQYECPLQQAIRLWPAFLEAKGKLPETIQEELEEVVFFWPEEAHWAKAERAKVRAWEIRTLAEAALELVRDGKPVTAGNLWALLHLSERHQMEYRNHWFRHEEEPKLAGSAYVWLGQPHLVRPAGHTHKPFERSYPFCGERGISRAEFFQRYSKKDIREAERAAATLGYAYEGKSLDAVIADTGADDEDEPPQAEGMSLLDEHGKPIPVPRKNPDGTVGRRGQEEAVFVTAETAARVRGELTPAERGAIEGALGRSLDDYVEKPFQEP
jgi:hypothetical protein